MASFDFQNMLGYLSLDIMCSSKLTVFLKLYRLFGHCSLLGRNNFRGQISEHILVPNGGFCLCVICSEVPSFPRIAKNYKWGNKFHLLKQGYLSHKLGHY